MKTSNKILLSLYIGVILIFTAIHVALYAKYKSGDYVIAGDYRAEHFIKKSYPGIRSVSVTGLQNFTIIPSDTLQLEVEKGDRLAIRYHIAGDSLVIEGDSVVERKDEKEEHLRSYQEVNLFLPFIDAVRLQNTEAWLRSRPDSTMASSYHLILNDASFLHLAENDYPDTLSHYIKNLDIISQGSEIELAPRLEIQKFQLVSRFSSFDDKRAIIGEVMIQSDSSSTITLQGSNFRKLNAIH